VLKRIHRSQSYYGRRERRRLRSASPLAQKYGAEKGWAFDTFLPERATRYTFRVFGTLLAIGVVLLVLRALDLLGGDR